LKKIEKKELLDAGKIENSLAIVENSLELLCKKKIKTKQFNVASYA